MQQRHTQQESQCHQMFPLKKMRVTLDWSVCRTCVVQTIAKVTTVVIFFRASTACVSSALCVHWFVGTTSNVHRQICMLVMLNESRSRCGTTFIVDCRNVRRGGELLWN